MTKKPLTPEMVSAILRDPDSPYFPTQIGVFCDGCGAIVEHDYMVSEGMTKIERLGVARKHLKEEERWSCGPDGDFCPSCKTPKQAICECGHRSHPGEKCRELVMPGPPGDVDECGCDQGSEGS